MSDISRLGVRIFADGAQLSAIRDLAANPIVHGFTTNPTLMRGAGITDYRAFAREAIAIVGDRPISFEVFSDEFEEMERQAREIATWGRNVNVKIPVTNTRGEFAGGVIKRLADAGVVLNITALMTVEQVDAVLDCLAPETEAFISVFAGRIADTGRDPMPIMAEAVQHARRLPLAKLIWASPRELLNVFQADAVGCHVITVAPDILKKTSVVGKDLLAYSVETVQMFRDDAVRAGYSI